MKNTKDMKKFLGILLGALLIVPAIFTNEKGGILRRISVAAEQTSEITLAPNAKAAYLADGESGRVVYARDETKRLPIASMCKIMTLVLCFDEIEKGTLSLDEEITVSKNASSMGGSQVFLEEGGKYPVVELLKSIAVCSANDSCVAMAERISGDEEMFCARMNERAAELGAENTLFSNCTGLPRDPQYSCAKDVALFLKELIRHKEYFSLSRIWTDRFFHPKGRYTDISNTNRLVRFYDGCDGGKTGYTSQAGFCLAATAKRGEMRLISVVIGEKSSDERFSESKKLLDYAFANYTVKTLVESEPIAEKAEVTGGKTKYLAVRPERASRVFSKKGETLDVVLDVRTEKKVKAPVKEGDRIGEIVVYESGTEIDRVELVSCETVERAGISDRLKEVASLWAF